MTTQMNKTPVGLWNDLWKANKDEWPAIVRKYKLDKDPKTLNYVAVNRSDVFNIISSVRSEMIDKGSVDKNSEFFREYVLIMNGER